VSDYCLEHILLEAARSRRKAWSDTKETALYRSICFLSRSARRFST